MKTPLTSRPVRWLMLAVLLPLVPAHAQFGGRGGSRGTTIRDSTELDYLEQMNAAIKPAFKDDVFTFARLIYQSSGYGRGGRGWQDDTADADVCLRWRLFQITSLKVGAGVGYKYINITPTELAGYPFTYITATDNLELSGAESKALRDYLLNGGFVMADDFWGDMSWYHVRTVFKQIFPELEPVELPLNHPVFHAVFNFKYAPQIPSAGYGYRGTSWDSADYAGDHDAHYYGIFDKKGRMMAIICRNNHYGDGWEHEGENRDYFDRFSMAQAYPMFINILYYSMTH
jgi:hypothetical protein